MQFKEQYVYVSMGQEQDAGRRRPPFLYQQAVFTVVRAGFQDPAYSSDDA